MSKKIKSSGKIVKPCTNCTNLQYLKVNLTYFKPDKNFNDKYKAQLLDRLHSLSQDTYVVVANRRKDVGFEFEKLDIGRDIPAAFKERFDPKSYYKLTVMRLYPNDNPVMIRIVGVTIKTIFYIFYAHIGETGYKR